MKRFAVIDVGSNSVRLMFVADGKVLYKRLKTTRLGDGLAETSRLKEERLEASAQAVATFAEQARLEGAEEVRVFATAAVRSAQNGKAFVARVKTLCGIDVDVISGEKEAEIGVLGALGEKDGGIIDVGGASTEIVVKKDDAFLYKKSVNIGIVRLKDTCGRDRALLRNAAETAAETFGSVPHNGTLTAVGGTATTLAAVKLKLKTYESEKITGTEITVAEMQTLAEELLRLTVAKTAALPGVPSGREDVLAGGAMLLAVLMEKLHVEKLIVSDRDNLEGYALKKGLTIL